MFKLASFFKSLLCLLVALEFVEGIAFAVVDIGIVGVKADSLVIGDERFLLALEFVENNAFFKPFFFGFE